MSCIWGPSDEEESHEEVLEITDSTCCHFEKRFTKITILKPQNLISAHPRYILLSAIHSGHSEDRIPADSHMLVSVEL